MRSWPHWIYERIVIKSDLYPGWRGHEIINEAGSRSYTVSNRPNLSYGKIRNWRFDRSVGLGLQVHPGFVNRQEVGVQKMRCV